MAEITVAATQMACTWNIEENVERAMALIRQAASRGAQIVLLQELFETPYFCIEQNAGHLKLATELHASPTIKRMAQLAAELKVVLPISWFERAGLAFFNSVAVIASNRVGTEVATGDESLQMTFYGSSFIADHTGVKVSVADRAGQSVLAHAFDLDALRDYRETWGIFRDRRPELYSALGTLDGRER